MLDYGSVLEIRTVSKNPPFPLPQMAADLDLTLTSKKCHVVVSPGTHNLLRERVLLSVGEGDFFDGQC